MRRATIAICLSLGMLATGVAQQEGSAESEGGPDSAVREKIEELGGRIMQVAQNDPNIEVSFHLGRNQDGLRTHSDPNPDAPAPPALDGELSVLSGLNGLVSLHLGGTDVTDEGLSHLAGLASLKRLHLEKTKVTDSGLAHLGKLENLAYLNLYETAVTDAGLRHLSGLESLKNLYLWQTQVTPDGVTQLQEALPDCKIDLGWEEPEAPSDEEASEPDA